MQTSAGLDSQWGPAKVGDLSTWGRCKSQAQTRPKPYYIYNDTVLRTLYFCALVVVPIAGSSEPVRWTLHFVQGIFFFLHGLVS